MSQWLFDLGNTRLKAAPLQADGTAGEVVALDHRRDGLEAAVAAMLPGRFDVAHVASVAGEALRGELLQVLSRHCRRIAIARTPRRWQGLEIGYPDPSRLGVDRFLAMLAVVGPGAGPALVCGIGTALTIDLVDGEGVHRGGRIAPSPTLMREAMHERVPHLPRNGGVYQEFADDTPDALASGCEGAVVALIERSLLLAPGDADTRPRLYLHGGGAEPLLPHLPEARLVPSLVLDGLARWAAA